MSHLLTMVQRRTIDRNNGGAEVLKGKPFLLVEPEFYWTSQIFDLCKEYFKASSVGDVPNTNLSVLAARISKGSSPVQSSDYQNPRTDLKLDKCLIKNLCTSLRNFCHGGYSKAGGDERKALQDIMYKLASEHTDFADHFFFNFEISFVCRRCVGGPFSSKFSFPVIYADGKKDFQNVLNDLDNVCKSQLSCPNDRNGVICKGTLRNLFNCNLLQFPDMIFFVMLINEEKTKIPESLELCVDDNKQIYTRLCSTNRFQCWFDENKKSYGPFYHKPLPTDIKDSWHSYPSILTSSGFLDFNNGKVYVCDDRLADETTAGSTHIYQKDVYNKYHPDVDTDIYLIPEVKI